MGVGEGVTGSAASEVGGSQVLWVWKATEGLGLHPESSGTHGGFSAGDGHGALLLDTSPCRWVDNGLVGKMGLALLVAGPGQ